MKSDNEPGLSFKLDGLASLVKLKIYDSDGALVRTIEQTDLDSGVHRIEWDGNDGNGNRLGAGSYTFSISAENASGDSISATTLITGHVEGVSYSDGMAYLIVDGRKIIFGNILEISEG